MQVGIAGAGLMGRLLALHLVRSGWQVTLFDPEQGTKSCGSCAAGMLAGVSELLQAEPLIWQLGQDALTHWSVLLAQLVEPVMWQLSGSVLLAGPTDRQELTYFTRRVSNKLGTTESIQRLTATDLALLEPELSQFNEGLYLPGEGCVDSQQFWVSSAKTLQTNPQVNFIQHAVTELGAHYLIAEGQRYAFDAVVDCRGFGAQADWTHLRGVRGEALLLHAPEVQLTRPIRLLHPRYPVYIVPRPEQQYVIGASMIESNDISAISVRSSMELLSAACYVHKGFLEARIQQTLVGCRPAFCDNLPKITVQQGLIRVNGLYRHGYLIGPALAAEVVRIIERGIAASQYPTLCEVIS